MVANSSLRLSLHYSCTIRGLVRRADRIDAPLLLRARVARVVPSHHGPVEPARLERLEAKPKADISLITLGAPTKGALAKVVPRPQC